MSTDPAAVMQRWFDEVWNEGREETIDELFAQDGIAYGLGDADPDVHGPEEFKLFFRNMRAALPDVRIRIEDMLVQGDKVAVRLVLEGTHTGDGLGLPASGKSVKVSGIVIGRVSGGQLREGWNIWNQLGLLRQMGALSVSGERDRFIDAAE